jgi:hypothetical protein
MIRTVARPPIAAARLEISPEESFSGVDCETCFIEDSRVMSPSPDLLSELEAWIGRFSAEARLGKRSKELVAAEIDLLRRAIVEIRGLREKLGERRATRSILAEDLNASNDE